MAISKQNILLLIILIVLCFLVLIPINPNQMPFTQRDSGVFLYTGWRITNGELPYRDVWDHKPPMIFYINALGLSIANQSRWGVWAIECVFLITASILGYTLLNTLFHPSISILSMFLFLSTVSLVISGGNLTSEYVLPLQFSAFWLIRYMDRDNFPLRNWAILGILAALAFLTKQTTIGIWLALVIYQTYYRITKHSIKEWVTEIGVFALSGAILIIIVCLFFWFQGGWADFWSAVVKFNYVYSHSGLSISYKIDALLQSMMPLAATGIFHILIIGILLSIVLLVKKPSDIEKFKYLLMIALISLPIELAFIALSGRAYPHYYISILPAMTIISGVTFWIIYKQLSSYVSSSFGTTIFSVVLMLLFALGYYQSYRLVLGQYKEHDNSSIVNYVVDHTSPEDKVLFWGAEAKDNFDTSRKGPSKFIYQYPLYTHNYTNPEMISGFLNDIIQNQPKLIIDTQNQETPIFEFPYNNETISEEINWIKSNYQPIDQIEDWIIYEYQNDN